MNPRQQLYTPVLTIGCLVILLSALLASLPLRAQPLVIAQISDRPKQDYAHLRPMARYAVSQLGEFGFDRAEVRLYRSVDELISAVRTGEVHWISETPYTAARLVDETGSYPLAKKWKNGQRHYQTIIYTQRDSNIRTLNDLAGQSIAFEHPFSFTSYYLPKQILEQHGIQLTPLQNSDDQPHPGEVGYRFSRNEKNNALWVDKGIVGAGALNDGDWENEERVPPAIRDRLRVIYRSKYYPRAYEIATPALPPPAAKRLTEVILGLQRPDDAALLDRYEHTEAFAPVLPDDLLLLNNIVSGRGTP